MQADSHQPFEILLPQCSFTAQLLRHGGPGRIEDVGIRRLLQRDLVHLGRPLVKLLCRHLRILAQARQEAGQRVPVLESVVKTRHQCECLGMIRSVFFNTPQRRERLLVLTAVELELGLRQQYRVCSLGRLLEGHAQPFVAALVLALQVRGPRGLQVVEQRRVTRARCPAQQPFAARQVAFGDGNQALGQLLSRADRAIAARGFAEAARRHDDLVKHPQRQHQGDGETHEDGYRHLHELATEHNGDGARIGKQEMHAERAEKEHDDNDDAEFHCVFSLSVRNWRSRRSDSEISGVSTANT